MNNDFAKQYFVYRLASGQILLESDAKVVPTRVGAVILLPSHSDDQESIPYRIKEIQFAPQSQEEVIIYIEVEPV
jgi:hypothetical protein